MGVLATLIVTTALAGVVGTGLGGLIGLHNISEGMAVSVPLISGGIAKWKSILITASTGIPTIIGALLGMLIIF